MALSNHMQKHETPEQRTQKRDRTSATNQPEKRQYAANETPRLKVREQKNSVKETPEVALLKEDTRKEVVKKMIQFGQGVSDDEVLQLIDESIAAKTTGTFDRNEQLAIAKEIFDNINALGPLQPLMEDSGISDILVNKDGKQVYVDKGGILYLTDLTIDRKECQRLVDRIAGRAGRHVDEASPALDCTTKDGSRVNITIPPMSIDGISISIRKFPEKPFNMTDLLSRKMMNRNMAKFLQLAVEGRNSLLISGGTGSGKSISKKVMVLTADGWVKNGDLKIGTQIYTRTGTLAPIVGIYPQGELPVWEIELKDGRIVECSGDHLWQISFESHGKYKEDVRSTEEMFENFKKVKIDKNGGKHNVYRYKIPCPEPIQYSEKDLKIDPYVLGFLIGDGCLSKRGNNVEFSTSDQEIIDEIERRMPDHKVIKVMPDLSHDYSYLIRTKGTDFVSPGNREYAPAADLAQVLRDYDLERTCHAKRIPREVFTASVEQRMDVLRGLLDSDGSINKKGCVSFCSVSRGLIDDVIELSRSLGMSAGQIFVDKRPGKYKITGEAYSITIRTDDADVFLLSRKRDRMATRRDNSVTKGAFSPQTLSPAVVYDAFDGEPPMFSEFITPYVFGVLSKAKPVGGGTAICINMKKTPEIAVDEITNSFSKNGISLVEKQGTLEGYTSPTKDPFPEQRKGANGFIPIIQSAGLDKKLNDRVFHDFYLHGAPETRFELLRGYLDCHSRVTGGTVEIASMGNTLFRESLLELLTGLGIETNSGPQDIFIQNCPPFLFSEGHPSRVALETFYEEHALGKSHQTYYVPIVDIRKTDRVEDMQCLMVDDPSHTFIIEDYVVTHNTTLLNVLSNCIPNTERIISIEDAAELRILKENLVRLEARDANAEGKGEITIRDCVIDTLRMRPDRIIVGECRSDEVVDMLQAMNTGHDGSLTTIHSNSVPDCLIRLETMFLMSGISMPVEAIRRQIVSAVDIIVQITRDKNGNRRVAEISTIDGMEKDAITKTSIFKYDEKLNRHIATGLTPHNIIDKCLKSGLVVPPSLFEPPSSEPRL